MLHLDTMQIITKQQFISSITAYLKQEAKGLLAVLFIMQCSYIFPLRAKLCTIHCTQTENYSWKPECEKEH